MKDMTYVSDLDIGNTWLDQPIMPMPSQERRARSDVPGPTFSITPAHSCPRISPSLSSKACPISVPVHASTTVGQDCDVRHRKTCLPIVQVQIRPADSRARHAHQGVFGVSDVGDFAVFQTDIVLAVPLFISSITTLGSHSGLPCS